MATKQAPIKDKYSKAQILDAIAASTAPSRKQVSAVLDSLGDVIEAHVKNNAANFSFSRSPNRTLAPHAHQP
jgi:hypothetical protein